MLDKDIKDIIKELKEVIEDLESDTKLSKIEKLKESLVKAHNQETIISIKKDSEGRADVNIEGTRLAILVTLAGLEKSIFKELDCSEAEFDLIKHTVGTREAK